jgi:hypothetical protein
MTIKNMRDAVVSLSDAKARLEQAKAAYLEIAVTAPAPELRAATEKIKALQAEVSAIITEGASPCPSCGRPPHGMEQPGTYEVGCTSCGFFRHTDGTARDHSARGGMFPKHTVEAWNEGPDLWRQPLEKKFSQADVDAMPTREEIAEKAKQKAAEIAAKEPVRA